jgi:hypothetical protein
VPEADGFDTVEIGGRDWRSLTVSFAGPEDVRLQVLSSLDPVEDRVASIRTLVVVLGSARWRSPASPHGDSPASRCGRWAGSRPVQRE